ncbi:MAG: MaoC family dehydratase N-terminal domain-containing protein [Burkholderiales bacterium]|nr:MaoC family dehydratase N-terminal domain-containing protein [Burkholderiales bacterium]
MIDKSLIGRELPPSTLTLERGRLRFYARAIGETDPVRTDLAAARDAGYADLPAPEGREMEAGADPGLMDAMEKMTPLGRGGTPDEAAGAGVLFGSPESDDASGPTLVCSGGLTGF